MHSTQDKTHLAEIFTSTKELPINVKINKGAHPTEEKVYMLHHAYFRRELNSSALLEHLPYYPLQF